MKKHLVFLGLGSNLGDRERNLSRAVELLLSKLKLLKLSSVYETEPAGYLEQPLFLNAVLKASTSLSPHALLRVAKDIEEAIGRQITFPNAPRLIDIDILFYDDWMTASPELVIPHPRLTDRGFVLIPLVEIAPDFIHPQHGKKASELLRHLSTTTGVRKHSEITIRQDTNGRKACTKYV